MRNITDQLIAEIIQHGLIKYLVGAVLIFICAFGYGVWREHQYTIACQIEGKRLGFKSLTVKGDCFLEINGHMVLYYKPKNSK